MRIMVGCWLQCNKHVHSQDLKNKDSWLRMKESKKKKKDKYCTFEVRCHDLLVIWITSNSSKKRYGHFFRTWIRIATCIFCEQSLVKRNAKDVEIFRNGAVNEFYRLNALITLEQVKTSVVGKKKNLNEKNFDGEANWSGVVNFH